MRRSIAMANAATVRPPSTTTPNTTADAVRELAELKAYLAAQEQAKALAAAESKAKAEAEAKAKAEAQAMAAAAAEKAEMMAMANAFASQFTGALEALGSKLDANHAAAAAVSTKVDEATAAVTGKPTGLSAWVPGATRRAELDLKAKEMFGGVELKDISEVRAVAQRAEWNAMSGLEKTTHVTLHYVLPAAACVTVGYVAATYINGSDSAVDGVDGVDGLGDVDLHVVG